MFKISIIHPSRNRPKQAEQAIKEWLGNTINKNQIEYILSVDKNDKDLNAYKSIGIRNGIYVSINKNKSAIEAINKAAKVSTANLIIVVSDDFSCETGWDEKILNNLDGNDDFFCKTKDGLQDFIITLPILDRKCYDSFGYIYHPGYEHLFCDTEMAAVSHMTNRTVYSDLIFTHNHYSTKKTKKDLVNVKNDKTWKQGKKLFYERKAINFGLKPEEIINPFPKELE
jgi:hypothetical protein